MGLKNISDDDVSSRSNADKHIEKENYASIFSLKNDIDNIQIIDSSDMKTNVNVNSTVSENNNKLYNGKKILVDYDSNGLMNYDSVKAQLLTDKKHVSDDLQDNYEFNKGNEHIAEENKNLVKQLDQIPVDQCI